MIILTHFLFKFLSCFCRTRDNFLYFGIYVVYTLSWMGMSSEIIESHDYGLFFICFFVSYFSAISKIWCFNWNLVWFVCFFDLLLLLHFLHPLCINFSFLASIFTLLHPHSINYTTSITFFLLPHLPQLTFTLKNSACHDLEISSAHRKLCCWHLWYVHTVSLCNFIL